MRDISVTELAAQLATDQGPVLLDVREPWECRVAGLAVAVCIPMNEIPARLDDVRAMVETDKALAVICHSGVRSRHVGRFLEQSGLSDVINVAGGIDAWSREIDPAIPRY